MEVTKQFKLDKYMGYQTSHFLWCLLTLGLSHRYPLRSALQMLVLEEISFQRDLANQSANSTWGQETANLELHVNIIILQTGAYQRETVFLAPLASHFVRYASLPPVIICHKEKNDPILYAISSFWKLDEHFPTVLGCHCPPLSLTRAYLSL